MMIKRSKHARENDHLVEIDHVVAAGSFRLTYGWGVGAVPKLLLLKARKNVCTPWRGCRRFFPRAGKVA